MKPIFEEDIGQMNCMVMQLPQFADLKSRPNIRKTLDEFISSLYVEQPQELFDAINYKLSEKLQETFFVNYGIEKEYSSRIISHLKTNLAFDLEKLFQNKGSRTIFKLLANLMESIFHRINFYNIEVHKEIVGNDYQFKYKLKPIYITDESTLIEEPQINIEKTRKYLMELINFEDFTVWPMTTDLVYIQISVGTDLVNNFKTFLHGIRAYASSYLSRQTYIYKSTIDIEEEINAGDLELLVAFFRLNILKKENPDWEVDDMLINGTYLPFFEFSQEDDVCSFMENMAVLFRDYKNADYSNRQDMENLRRRWQKFLMIQFVDSSAAPETICFNNIDELNEKIKSKYPRLYEDYFNDLALNDKSKICNFFIKIYSIFYGGTYSSFIQPENRKCFTNLEIDREIIRYEWTENGIVLSNDKDFDYTPTTIGVHNLRLEVENADGRIDTDYVKVEVTLDSPDGPIADAGANKLALIGAEFTVVGRAIPLTSPIRSWVWKDENDTIVSTNQTLKHTPNRVGDEVFTLIVTDDLGIVSKDSFILTTVRVKPPEIIYPIADAGMNKKIQVNTTIRIEGSGEDKVIEQIHDQEWIITYLDIIFGNLFLSESFISQFFRPILDLFSKYFFPVELDYISDLIPREKIKDKWNSISTEQKLKNRVTSRHTSLQTPIRGIDWAASFIKLNNWHSYINHRDEYRSTLLMPRIESWTLNEGDISRLTFSRNRDYLITNERIDVNIF